jgi:hypothetical protein
MARSIATNSRVDRAGLRSFLADQHRAGEHPDWDEYRVAMTARGKCLIRITVDDWGPLATGGFPARLA